MFKWDVACLPQPAEAPGATFVTVQLTSMVVRHGTYLYCVSYVPVCFSLPTGQCRLTTTLLAIAHTQQNVLYNASGTIGQTSCGHGTPFLRRCGGSRISSLYIEHTYVSGIISSIIDASQAADPKDKALAEPTHGVSPTTTPLRRRSQSRLETADRVRNRTLELRLGES